MDCCYSFVAKVNSGFEDVSAQEIETLISRKVEQGREKIFFDGNSSDVYKINLLSRSIFKLLILCVRGRIHNFDDIYNISKEIDYSQYIPAGKTFGVTGARHGDHEFTSMDVAGEVGQAVIDSVKKTRGDRLEVNLDSPDVEIYALLRHNELIIGINTTGESLHRRFYRNNTKHPAPLNPTVAYSLLHLSGWNDESLLDPMCGTGTILIEAAL